MAEAARKILVRLEALRMVHGEGAAGRKLELLRALDRRALRTAGEVLRLHEILCFLRAFPDSEEVLARVEGMLARFHRRGDLRRHRRALADSGIAGTEIRYSFYWFTAQRLARRHPGRLTIDWREFEGADRLAGILHLLVPYCETPGLDELDLAPREWIETLKGPGETDAEFLIRRFEAMRVDSFARETLFEQLDVPMVLAPGRGTPGRGTPGRGTPRRGTPRRGTPSRTREKDAASPVVWQTGPLRSRRPDLRVEARKPPPAVRPVPPRRARELIELACDAMVTRARDLDVFVHADPRDVRMIECGGGSGLQLACFGTVPERRLLLESVYGCLTLRNGVPVGYVLTSALFRSAGIAYNVFESFRGAESAWVYGRVLAATRLLFGAESFHVDPYQLGHHNQEGLRSGAWWFYYKLGLRPDDPGVKRLVRAELARRKRNPEHRSSLAVLQQLTAANMHLHLGRPRRDVLGHVSPGEVGLRISRYLARRFGGDREAGIRACAREAAQLLGVRFPGGLGRDERLWWRRWSPLVLLLPGVGRWSESNRRALARVIAAKGGRRESDFVRLFDRHTPLRRAVLKLAKEGEPS